MKHSSTKNTLPDACTQCKKSTGTQPSPRSRACAVRPFLDCCHGTALLNNEINSDVCNTSRIPYRQDDEQRGLPAGKGKRCALISHLTQPTVSSMTLTAKVCRSGGRIPCCFIAGIRISLRSICAQFTGEKPRR